MARHPGKKYNFGEGKKKSLGNRKKTSGNLKKAWGISKKMGNRKKTGGIAIPEKNYFWGEFKKIWGIES